MEITSVNNELVKETVKLQQKKYRTQTGKFLLEGYKPIKEASDFGIKIEKIFVDKSKVGQYSFTKAQVIETTQSVLKKLATTDSAPDAVAVAEQKIYDKSILSKSEKVVLLEDIKDLGNLGTIVRTSVAFGVDAIVLFGESVDIYNPKSVRSSVGNLWKIPIIHILDFQELLVIFKNFEKIATLPHTNNILKEYKPKYPVLIMFGSEANGLSEDLINFADSAVKIEMSDNVESLNLAVSVAVVLYSFYKT